jgi:hypothetical protein
MRIWGSTPTVSRNMVSSPFLGVQNRSSGRARPPSSGRNAPTPPARKVPRTANVAIYNMCFATLGGGERRTAALAAHLAERHDVRLFVLSPLDISIVRSVFGIDLSRVRVAALYGSRARDTPIGARPLRQQFIRKHPRMSRSCRHPHVHVSRGRHVGPVELRRHHREFEAPTPVLFCRPAENPPAFS